MKKTLTIVAIIAIFSFSNPPKTLTVSGDLPEWNKHLSKLDNVRALVDRSNLPNQEVKFIIQTIDSLGMFIVPQLNKQLADTSKKK